MKTLLEPSFGLIFWTVVNFLILVFLLGKFAWKPIMKVLDEREEKIKNDISSAQEARAEAQKIQKEIEAKLEDISNQSIQKLKEAQEIANEEKKKILDSAANQANAMVAQAKAEIAGETQKAIETLKAQMADTTLLALKKIITKQEDEKTSRAQVQAVLKEIEEKAGK